MGEVLFSEKGNEARVAAYDAKINKFMGEKRTLITCRVRRSRGEKRHFRKGLEGELNLFNIERNDNKERNKKGGESEFVGQGEISFRKEKSTSHITENSSACLMESIKSAG